MSIQRLVKMMYTLIQCLKVIKGKRIIHFARVSIQYSIPIIVQYNTHVVRKSKLRWNKKDNVLLCDNLQPCRWILIDCHYLLFDGTKNSCITRLLQHYKQLLTQVKILKSYAIIYVHIQQQLALTLLIVIPVIASTIQPTTVMTIAR